jgi:Tfp pilus assembly protein PilF
LRRVGIGNPHETIGGNMARRTFTVIFAMACMFSIAAGATPYVPTDGKQVIERLPTRTDPQQRELQQLRSRLATAPDDVQLATQMARRYIEIGRGSGDPRYLGYAQAALAPWWKEPAPPPDVRILRATLLQNQHRFSVALADLDGLLKQDRGNAQAWLTRATVLQVQGRFDEAKASCARLFALAPELVTSVCFANVAGVTGQADKAYALLQRALARDRDADAAIRTWAHTLTAETAERLGRSADAEQHFRQALALDPSDTYLLGAYADFLLDRRRASEVVPLLENCLRADGLLLRYAEALHQLHSPQAERHVRMLQDRFAAAMQRGHAMHQREQARLALHLLNEPKEALRLAQQNWEVQKEPADARILLESAVAAGDRDAIRAATEWIKHTGLDDPFLSAIITHTGA